MIAHAGAYPDPRTDHRLPPVPRCDFDHPNLSIVAVQRRDGATENLKDIKLWVAGSQRTIRAFERFIAWHSDSRTDSDDESRLASLPEVEEVTSPSSAPVSLAELPQGWDGYEGFPVRSGVAEQARLFMEQVERYTTLMPDIIPLSNGGLQLEWYVGRYEIEVEIEPDCTTVLLFECPEDGRSSEITFDAVLDLSDVADFFRELPS